MSEVKQHGRRRATAPLSSPELSTASGSRREALAAERAGTESQGAIAGLVRAGLANGAGQKVGIALAATGLALAVTVPSAVSVPVANVEMKTVSATESVVTAAADVPISFVTPNVASVLNPDGQLKETLKVTAAKVTPQAAKGTLSAPLKTLVKSSPFGQRINPLTGSAGEMHTGQDYAIACSTAVFAAAGGTVTFAGWHEYGGGNRVVISHGNGLSTSYNHLSSIGVKVGQKIERGQQVALSGTTGASTGCHLHFEVIVDDETVDPMGWL
ncbi:peptidase M23 [Arthrobacter sp. ERGS1:01]|uniref:M23 family metallopeptidase n=1 Tax=Arthrobacter sp. ERGS1:01 TaxID=1704044 RepID=UPI0006B5ECAE|nr:M23 family metallopeptidase [Arthrobacter sp. ERGS1:01]ALE04954.1 peptidase M23 [Arthrobacter sp. ERGS1:01]